MGAAKSVRTSVAPQKKPTVVQQPKATVRYWMGLLFLKAFGWRTEGITPPSKCIFIASPHTSYWDTPFSLAVSYVMGVRLQFLVKHTMFWGPMGPFMRWLGGIPVDRSGRHNIVDLAVDAFNAHDHLVLMIAPEGTRSKVDHWKSGFYRISQGANVPLVLGFLDFKRKVGGLGPVIHLTGDQDHDMDRIRAFYEGRDIQGKYPELMGPIRMQPTVETAARKATG